MTFRAGYPISSVRGSTERSDGYYGMTMDKTNETLAERIGDKQPERRRTLAELDFGQKFNGLAIV